MFSVDQVISVRLPGISNAPWLYKPIKGALRYLLHEQDFIDFAAQYPHLRGLEFVEQVLDYFNFRYAVRDNEIERIPPTGRIVIIANHPIGSLDSLALLKLVSDIRPDAKVLANRLLMAAEPLHSLLLPVNNMQGDTERSWLNRIQQHLNAEGALILFPAGEVSRLQPNGIRDGKWHSGFLRFATHAKAPILPVYIDGRNSALFYGASVLYKPLSTMLLIQEMFGQQRKHIEIRIGEQIPYSSFAGLDIALRDKVKLFKRHLYRLAKDKPALFRTQRAIAHPEERIILKKAVEACQLLGQTGNGKQIYLYQHQQSSPILREIGRLRETAFRAVGEGSGNRRDIDKFDNYYQQLLLWDKEDLEIVGAYRLADSLQVIRQHGLSGLYTASLFQFGESMQPYLATGLELGRSFVQPKYWGRHSLDYLWHGIGAYLKQHSHIRYLFGVVSLSNSYPSVARDSIVYFYSLYFKPGTTAAAIPRYPYQLSPHQLDTLQQYFCGEDYVADFTRLKQLLANMGLTVPTLYKQYSELCEPGGVQFLAFGTDPNFADCIDGLVLIDLARLKTKKARYLS
jgi:putative hemolysin